MKQKRDRYEMHKYWGKKPSSDLKTLIEKYTVENDIVLDPFSGYGVFCCEAFIANRNVITNDLNPIANFLNIQLLEKEVDLALLNQQWKKIKIDFEPFVKKWYEWNVEGESVQLISVLRNKENIPIKAKYKLNGDTRAREIELEEEEVQKYLAYEKTQAIEDWYPTTKLIQNSRISAREGMTVADLFTKRTLACHAKLLILIETHSSGKERALLKVAFTANLANCSKLLPPIKSRGDMAPGAWMTGFYIGKTYLENNVLKYFENRFSKILKGKQDYLNQFGNTGEFNFNPIQFNNSYKVLQNDAKKLSIEDETVDYVFTDPPYGDAVPYFEQSIIWNSWLKLTPDYENEIVISDSKKRKKRSEQYEQEINLAFAEIRRVLKPNKFFSLTYHSLSGIEWKSITNACIKNGFELVDYKWLVQKSFTPRQINRLKSIKGDVLVTLQKSKLPTKNIVQSDIEVSEIFIGFIKKWLKIEALETNEIFLRIMKIVFSEKILIGNVDLL
ncbi:MAG: DNA methyltransferase, partial [Chitinophagales bacterium]